MFHVNKLYIVCKLIEKKLRSIFLGTQIGNIHINVYEMKIKLFPTLLSVNNVNHIYCKVLVKTYIFSPAKVNKQRRIIDQLWKLHRCLQLIKLHLPTLSIMLFTPC